jgi:hypothetical protein
VPEEPDLAVDHALLPVLRELRDLEPIFHRGLTLDELEAQVAPDFWEIGASGRRYSREFVLETVRGRLERAEPEEPLETSEFSVRDLGSGTYLLTYTLRQPNRLTRRTTLWRRSGTGGWQLLFHQGTPVEGG